MSFEIAAARHKALGHRGFGVTPTPANAPRPRTSLMAHDAKMLALVSTSAPTSLRKFATRIANQGGLGTCVENSSAAALWLLQIEARTAAPQWPARLPPYAIDRVRDAKGDQKALLVDSGTTLTTHFYGVHSLGWAPEVNYPYSDDATTFTLPVSDEYFREAYDLREKTGTSSFRQVTTADEVATAITNGAVVQIGLDVSNAFARNDFDASVAVGPMNGADVDGGHSVDAIGFRFNPQTGAREWEIMNPWGDEFADGGFCWFTEECLMTSFEMFAIWWGLP